LILALLSEVQGETRAENFIEPAELALQYRCIVPDRVVAPAGRRGSQRKRRVGHCIFDLF
jgi:hypothetical protein